MPEDPGTLDNLDDTQSTVNWQEHIPEEYRGKGYWEPLKDKNLSDVLKTYGEAQSLIGSSVRVPTDDDAESWNKFYAKMGRPETADKYEANMPSVEGVEWEDDQIGSFRKVAHDAGLNSRQVQKLYDWYGQSIQDRVNGDHSMRAKETKETEDALRSEWGLNFDRNRSLAKRGAQHLFGSEGLEALEQTVGNNRHVMRGLAKIGRDLMEDGLIGESSAEFGGLSRSDAKREIEKLTAPDSPYWTKPGQKPDPRSQEIRDKVTELFKVAHPDDEG